jgi:predicted ArsR family transcriptional regulator
MLSDALLTQVGASVNMEALAKRLEGESNFASHPMAKRLNLVIEKLNRMNYHARWEAGAEGPRIIFGHCPYAAIVENHPELCGMDMKLLSNSMARPISQDIKSETQRVGMCPFVFLMR